MPKLIVTAQPNPASRGNSERAPTEGCDAGPDVRHWSTRHICRRLTLRPCAAQEQQKGEKREYTFYNHIVRFNFLLFTSFFEECEVLLTPSEDNGAAKITISIVMT